MIYKIHQLILLFFPINKIEFVHSNNFQFEFIFKKFIKNLVLFNKII